MSDGLRIRRAAPSDADAVSRLAREVAAEPEGWLLTLGTWRSSSDERRAIRLLRRHPDAALFIAETAEEGIVGRLSITRDRHPSSQHIADLGLMVARGHRRRGAGRALLEAAVEWARASGVSKLELHVFPHNEAAIKLYESFGFEREGYRKRHYRRGQEYVDAILMAYFVPGQGS
jgi:RimJ/RimL family protein N-acetyltransferase